VATLNFTTTDRKVFTPVSGALGALSAGAGTIVVLMKNSGATGDEDFAGLTDSGGTNFYHGLVGGAITSGHLCDDSGPGSVDAPATWPSTNTTIWQMLACDWAASASTENFRWRDQTGLGTWTTSTSVASYGGTKAGPGTGGWLRLGYIGDGTTGARSIGVIAIWAGVRFSTSDYGDFRKTSDLYNHALGHPTFLCQLTATTPVDLIGGSTYSSTNSTGTTLTGADPDNWTMDGLGSAVRPPARRVVRPRVWRPAGARFAR
jgi:hypothetical protein